MSKQTFTAIVLPGDTKIRELTPEGIAEHLNIAGLPGILVFSKGGKYLRLQRHALPQERTELFDALKLPQVSVLPIVKTSSWLCIATNLNQYQKSVRVKAPLPLLFEPDNLSLFDPILVRVYKQRRIWLLYEDLNERYPLEQIQLMRKAMDDFLMLGKFDDIRSLPMELRSALELAIQSTEQPIVSMTKYALKLAGAEFKKLTDLGSGQFRVAYHYKDYDDEVVIDDKLTVISSGICLSGRDKDYDLTGIIFVKDRAPNRGNDDD